MRELVSLVVCLLAFQTLSCSIFYLMLFAIVWGGEGGGGGRGGVGVGGSGLDFLISFAGCSK